MAEDAKPNGAEPSAAPETQTTLTPEIRAAWNKEHQPTTEAPASSDAPKAAKSEGKPESAPAPDSGKEPQEKGSRRKPDAEERIAQLTARIKELESGKETKQENKETKPAEASPAKPAEVKAAPKPEAPKEPDIEDPQYSGEDGWKKYEAAVKQYTKDLAKYEAAQAVEKYKDEQRQGQELQRVQQQIKNGREKYADFDAKAEPVIQALGSDPNSPLYKVVGESPVFEHLIYTIGGEGQEFIDLAKSDPWKAVKKVAIMEALIMEELSKPSEKADAKEPKEAKEKPPVEPVTRAPKPVSEVGGRSTATEDAGQQAARSGDFRTAKEEWTREYLASRK